MSVAVNPSPRLAANYSRLCPLLNGEWKQDDSGQLDDAAFMVSDEAVSF